MMKHFLFEHFSEFCIDKFEWCNGISEMKGYVVFLLYLELYCLNFVILLLLDQLLV